MPAYWSGLKRSGSQSVLFMKYWKVSRQVRSAVHLILLQRNAQGLPLSRDGVGRSSTGSSQDPMERSTAAWSETPQVSTGLHWNLRYMGISFLTFRCAIRALTSLIQDMIYKMKIPLTPPFSKGEISFPHFQ